jgi:LysR family transcriptional regulator, regulator of abg operon
LTYAGSILSQIVFLLSSEMLMIGPARVLDFEPYQDRLVRIPVRGAIDAPPIVLVRRAALPLTPAAEHFCDLIRRASAALHRSPAARSKA